MDLINIREQFNRTQSVTVQISHAYLTCLEKIYIDPLRAQMDKEELENREKRPATKAYESLLKDSVEKRNAYLISRAVDDAVQDYYDNAIMELQPKGLKKWVNRVKWEAKYLWWRLLRLTSKGRARSRQVEEMLDDIEENIKQEIKQKYK